MAPARPRSPARVRLDKWLWAARFYRTRTHAARAVDLGQVRIDGARIKPAHVVQVGQRITVRKAAFAWHVDVTGCSERRGSAADAARLYVETAESLAARRAQSARRAALAPQRFPGRPTKRDRRRLEDFLNDA